jgi:hypothetical protein
VNQYKFVAGATDASFTILTRTRIVYAKKEPINYNCLPSRTHEGKNRLNYRTRRTLLQFKGKLTAENVLDLMMAKALTFLLFLPLQQSHHESRYLKKKKKKTCGK